MPKNLSEMSLEELWQLFPISLTEHKTIWSDWYKDEEFRLRSILPQKQVKRISHIGSTAIPAIWAKPIIDILLEITSDCDIEEISGLLVKHGYLCMNKSQNRISLNKGYTENGFAEKVFHLHIRYDGDNEELYFRDYLLENEAAARKYEKLKLELWKKYEFDRDGYTNAKTEFVNTYTKKAKQLYGKQHIEIGGLGKCFIR